MSTRLPRTGFIKGQTSKEAFSLVMLDLRFHISAVEYHFVVYHLSI